jgi:acetyltransferase-like isoleucine patch superfamily enzyme
MSWFSDYLRRCRIDSAHQTRRHLARQIEKHGFQIGDYTYGRPRVRYSPHTGTKLVIGHFCSIAEDVEFILGPEHRTDWATTFPFKGAGGWEEFDPSFPQFHSRGDIAVGSDVWIGTGATILSGVTIGHGAVIGARAVVACDVAPYTIAVGNPARAVRRRFSIEIINALLQLRWWDLDRTEIQSLLPLLQNGNVAAFIRECVDRDLLPRSAALPERNEPLGFDPIQIDP